jgi:hydroxyacyl-ACP dehydratase HTD2-like protein with hotdog domain
MTALMLLEVLENNRPHDLQISTFDYRATNQLFVDRRITIHGSWLGKHEVRLCWAQTDDGIVGMTGEASLKTST